MARFKVTTHTGNSFFLNDSDEINRGGEGRILSVPKRSDVVAKIYFSGKQVISEQQFTALQKLDKDVFVVPQELLYVKSAIIGYTMPFIQDDFFPFANVFSKNFCKKNQISNKIKMQIGEHLILAVQSVHDLDYVIGDLNQFNILCNKKGQIKLLDTDSYQTDYHNHTGLVLEEIRDFQYNGTVNKNSDYFALSVLLFYMFTHTHPFKGVHARYKSLRERMVHRIPIFSGSPELKIPRCYSPVSDAKMMQQFEDIFVYEKRFLFHLNGLNLTNQVQKTVTRQSKISLQNVVIQQIAKQGNVLNVKFEDEAGYIEYNDKFVIYSTKNRGWLSQKNIIKKTDCDSLFLTNLNTVFRKQNTLFYVSDSGKYVELSNFKFEENAFTDQYGNILIVVQNDSMFWLYLDDIMGKNIKLKRTEVFGKAFSAQNGFIQRQAGVNRIFYNTGKDIATVKINQKKIKNIYRQNQTGILQFVDNDKITVQYFKVIGLNIEFSDVDNLNFTHFAYMPTGKQNGLIFEPSDNEIIIRRSDDFSEMSKISCDFISEQTALFYGKSGIIAWEDNSVLLINTK